MSDDRITFLFFFFFFSQVSDGMRKAILRLASKQHDYTFNENKITFQSNNSSQILLSFLPSFPRPRSVIKAFISIFERFPLSSNEICVKIWGKTKKERRKKKRSLPTLIEVEQSSLSLSLPQRNFYKLARLKNSELASSLDRYQYYLPSETKASYPYRLSLAEHRSYNIIVEPRNT